MFKPLIKKIKHYNNYGFDCETFGDDNKFLMASIALKDHSEFFSKISDLKAFIFENKKLFKDSIIWCHNLAFDFLTAFSDDIKNFKIIQRGSDFISCKSYIDGDNFEIKGKRPIKMHDTMNFYKGKLKTIGEFMNFHKLETPEIIGQKPRTKQEWETMKTYNIRDSELTRDFADYLQKNFNDIGCEIKPTIASTSLDLFKRKYLKNSFYFPTIHDSDIMRNAYYGGRTEIFNRGYSSEKINVYDFNSIYPYVMKNFEYPDPNTMRKYRRSNRYRIFDYDGITNVDMFCPKDADPMIPVRQDKLIFPQGKISGYYTNFEIRKAIEHGYKLLKIKDCIIYKKNVSIFKDFVDDLYALRMRYKAERSNMQLIPKILLNSLYGKFGMRLDNKSEIRHISTLTGEEERSSDILGDSDYRRVKVHFSEKTKPGYINPIWSIYVTAYARMMLFEKMRSLKNCFYVDTDSIFTTENLNSYKDLGELKLEYNIKECYIVKPKFYALRSDDGWICKIKGLRGMYNKKTNSWEKLQIDDFLNILNDKKFRYQKFMKYRECLIRNIAFNKKFIVEKELSLEDDKRDWYDKKFSPIDFQSSRPLVI